MLFFLFNLLFDFVDDSNVEIVLMVFVLGNKVKEEVDFMKFGVKKEIIFYKMS